MLRFPSRRTGSAGNRMATDFFAAAVKQFRYDVECPEFACIDWTHGDANLSVEGEPYAAHISPYALGCVVDAELAVVTSVDELEAADVRGKALLLMGEIVSEQLMPKNFIFYNPDSHQRIIQPAGREAAGRRLSAPRRANPEMAGGSIPFL